MNITFDNFLIIATGLGVFFIAGSIHEFAHAVSAYQLGDTTAKRAGRLTLNPLSHIDPIGTVLFPIIMISTIGHAFGWMRPVPVMPGNFRYPIKDMAIVSFAGPFSNFVQACFGILLISLFPILDHFILNFYITINFLLMGFNLLPIPPLDGGGILRYFLRGSIADLFDQFSRYSGFILVFLLLFVPKFMGYWLSPFYTLANIITKLNLSYIILINLVNLGIIAYFFNDRLMSLWNKATWKAKKISDNRKKYKTTTENIKTQKKTDPFVRKINTEVSLTEEEKKELESIKADLDSNVNICPPEDFEANDQVCRDCDWYNNCLVRKLENQSTTHQ